MKMGNAFAGVGSVVDYDPVTGLLQPLPLGDCRRRKEQMTEQRGVFSRRLPKARNDRLWNYENMHGRLWIDVANGDAFVVLVDDLSRDFPVDDSLKKSHESCIRNSAAPGYEPSSSRTKSTTSSRRPEQSWRQFFAERKSLIPQCASQISKRSTLASRASLTCERRRSKKASS